MENKELQSINMNSGNTESFSTGLRYFWYHFRETFLRLVLMCFISGNVMYSSLNEMYHSFDFTPTSFVVLLALAAFLLPKMELKQFKNRRNLDLWYQMPISRRNLAVVHFANACVQVFIAYLLGLVFLAIKCFRYDYEFLPVLCFVLSTFIVFIPILGYNMFIYDRANSSKDGVIFQIAYISLIPTVLCAFLSLLARLSIWDFNYSSLIVAILYGPNIVFYNIIELFDFEASSSTSFNEYNYYRTIFDEYFVISMIIVIVSIVATVSFFVLYGKTPSHKIEDISDSWFGYKTLIPVFSVSTSLLLGSAALYTWLGAAILCYIAYVVYRRSIKIKKIDILMIVGLTILSIVWGLICSKPVYYGI